MLNASFLAGVCDELALRHFERCIHLLPVLRHAEDAVDAFQRCIDTSTVTCLSLNHFDAELCKGFCLVAFWVPREGTNTPVLARHERLEDVTALVTGSSEYSDDLFVGCSCCCHCNLYACRPNCEEEGGRAQAIRLTSYARF